MSLPLLDQLLCLTLNLEERLVRYASAVAALRVPLPVMEVLLLIVLFKSPLLVIQSVLVYGHAVLCFEEGVLPLLVI